MEQEKSPSELFKAYAKKNGWEYNPYKTVLRKRHGVSIRKTVLKKGNTLFVSKFDPGNMSKYDSYSGVFIPVTGKISSVKLLLRKRDFSDKLSFRKNKLRFKIGSESFDSKVLVETNNDIEAHKLLSSSKIQTEIVNFFNNYDERIYIGINELNPKVEELKDKSFLSVHKLMRWMKDEEIIEQSLKVAEMLNNKINNRYV